MSGAVEPRDIRVSDAEREHAGKLLQRAVGQGRITLTEFDERMGTAMAARTRGELNQVLADIPGAVLQPAAAKDVVRLRSGMGDIKRRGHWLVPPVVEVSTTMGDAVLDFTQAEFSSASTTIELGISVGSLVLVVPPGVVVDSDEVRVGVGDLKDRTDADPEIIQHRIVLRGRLGMGDVRIQHPRSWRFGPLTVHSPWRLSRGR